MWQIQRERVRLQRAAPRGGVPRPGCGIVVPMVILVRKRRTPVTSTPMPQPCAAFVPESSLETLADASDVRRLVQELWRETLAFMSRALIAVAGVPRLCICPHRRLLLVHREGRPTAPASGHNHVSQPRCTPQWGVILHSRTLHQTRVR